MSESWDVLVLVVYGCFVAGSSRAPICPYARADRRHGCGVSGVWCVDFRLSPTRIVLVVLTGSVPVRVDCFGLEPRRLAYDEGVVLSSELLSRPRSVPVPDYRQDRGPGRTPGGAKGFSVLLRAGYAKVRSESRAKGRRSTRDTDHTGPPL